MSTRRDDRAMTGMATANPAALPVGLPAAALILGLLLLIRP
jgi:hypothetical protein